MPIQVYSEIAPLRRVLLHRPGQELEHLVPGSLERLLFDDIPYLKGAQAEHDRFAQVLRDNGVEVVYLSKLTAEALSQDKALKEAFIRDFTQKSGSVAHRYERELQAYLGSIEDVHEMVLQTMAGIPFSDLALDHAESLTAMLHCKADFALEPIPNLYFTRDPFASVGVGVAGVDKLQLPGLGSGQRRLQRHRRHFGSASDNHHRRPAFIQETMNCSAAKSTSDLAALRMFWS